MAYRHTRLLAAVFACLVLLGTGSSSALAKPSGNPTSSALCVNGGYRNYTDAAGNPFSSDGQCAKYAAKGGTLVLVFLSATYTYQPGDGGYILAVAGAGLQPNTLVWATGTLGSDPLFPGVPYASFGPIQVTVVSSTGEAYREPFFIACGRYTELIVAARDAYGNLLQDGGPVPC